MAVQAEILIEQIVSFIGVYLIVTLALNVKAGHTGIPDFGHAMFFAVGGIVVGNLTAQLAAWIASKSIPEVTVSDVLKHNIETMTLLNKEFFPKAPLVSIALIIFAIVLAVVMGGILGWLASLPALRLRGEYLAILLLAVSEALRIFTTYTKQIMGELPTVGLVTPNLFAWTGDSGMAATVFTLIMALLAYIIFERIHNSPAGRLLRAVRDDEDAVKALGKDVVTSRRDAMIIGSAMAALAGVVYSLNPHLGGGAVAAVSIYNRLYWTFWPWALMILGGMASNRGIALAVGIVGISIVWPIRLYRQQVAAALGVEKLGITVDAFANALEYIFVGLLIILVLMFRPQGMIPEPPSRTIPPKKISEKLASSPTKSSEEET